MRQVFLNAPWVHSEEPAPLKEIFKKFGERRKYPKGYMFEHGGSHGNVYLVQKGLVFFAFPDNEDKFRVFGIIPPERVVGDLDAITKFKLNVWATSVRPTEALVVSGETYRKEIESNPELMRLYTINALAKEETHMEGLMAVFTLPLEKRLIALCSSIINSYYPLKITELNPVPLQLTTFEMADIVSSNRSTISTVINQWIEEGLAKRDGRWLHLHGKLFSNEYDWLNLHIHQDSKK